MMQHSIMSRPGNMEIRIMQLLVCHLKSLVNLVSQRNALLTLQHLKL